MVPEAYMCLLCAVIYFVSQQVVAPPWTNSPQLCKICSVGYEYDGKGNYSVRCHFLRFCNYGYFTEYDEQISSDSGGSENSDVVTINISTKNPTGIKCVVNAVNGTDSLPLHFIDNVTVAFQQHRYDVEEGDSYLKVCIAVSNPIPLKKLGIEIKGKFTTNSRNATGGEDYRTVSKSIILTLTNKRRCTNVFIIDDDEVESDESFAVYFTHSSIINLPPFHPPLNIIVENATAVIHDNDNDNSWTSIVRKVGGTCGGIVGFFIIVACVAGTVCGIILKKDKFCCKDGPNKGEAQNVSDDSTDTIDPLVADSPSTSATEM